MKILGIIPARYGSTRFPAKPLADINGKPMIQWVYEQAKKCKSLTEVIIATDDKRIEDVVKKFGGNPIMTSGAHESGTDRCYEAMQKILPLLKGSGGDSFEAIINIQGDEPFIQPEQISKVANCFKDKNVQIATLAKKLDSIHELTNHNTTKVIVGKKFRESRNPYSVPIKGTGSVSHRSGKEALYFSRTAIPYYRGEDFTEWVKLHDYYKHIGIYGYRPDILAEITKLERSPLEIAESLEQLRWLENGYRITVEITDLESHSIDTPEDLKKIILGFK